MFSGRGPKIALRQASEKGPPTDESVRMVNLRTPTPGPPMPVAILCIAVVWAASLAIVVVVAVSMDGVSCLAEAGGTLADKDGETP